MRHRVRNVLSVHSLAAALIIGISICSYARPSDAGPDFPWSCRDADAVMAAARKFSEKTPVIEWDNAKIFQAEKEYLQCGKEAADDEDRFKAGIGLTYAMEVLAYKDYLRATNVNLLTEVSKSARRSFFNFERTRAIRGYGIAQQMAHLTVASAGSGGVDSSDFEAWVQHYISDPLAELRALSFEKARTKQPSKVVAAHAVPRPAIVRAGSIRQSCARPNVPAATIHAIEPDTPPMAAQQGISGVVQVRVALDENSHITDMSIFQSPSAILNSAALIAARNSTFQTEVRDCKPIAAEYIFSVEFSSQ
jgi:TonB family protein